MCRIIVYYSLLQVIVCHSILEYFIVYCSILQYVIVGCIWQYEDENGLKGLGLWLRGSNEDYAFDLNGLLNYPNAPDPKL